MPALLLSAASGRFGMIVVPGCSNPELRAWGDERFSLGLISILLCPIDNAKSGCTMKMKQVTHPEARQELECRKRKAVGEPGVIT
jgi:hypothetical protein